MRSRQKATSENSREQKTAKQKSHGIHGHTEHAKTAHGWQIQPMLAKFKLPVCLPQKTDPFQAGTQVIMRISFKNIFNF